MYVTQKQMRDYADTYNGFIALFLQQYRICNIIW